MSDLPELRIPRENDDYVPVTSLTLDGADTTAVDIGWAVKGTRPISNWLPYPGPKAPTTPGRYLVEVRETGGGATIEIGWLVVD